MPTLISGPAGANKTAHARQLIENAATGYRGGGFSKHCWRHCCYSNGNPMDAIPNGLESQAYALAMAEYLRRVIMTVAAEREIDVVTTSSDGAGTRRRALLDALGPVMPWKPS